jgi:hypothetical protein
MSQGPDRAQCSAKEMVDFDWSLRMALSSDKVSGLRKPLLQLKLDTADPTGKAEETLLELDSDELTKLLKTLIAVQKVSGMSIIFEFVLYGCILDCAFMKHRTQQDTERNGRAGAECWER